MAFIEFVVHVDRRKQVIVGVIPAMVAHLIVAQIRHQFHLAMFKAQSGIHVKSAPRQGSSQIARSQLVVALVVVGHVQFFNQIEFVCAKMVGIAQQRRDVAIPEVFRQVVVGHVPVVDKFSCVVFSRAVFAIGTQFERGLKTAEVEVMLLVDAERENMLIKLRELTADLIASGQGQDTGIKRIVDGISAAVGKATVGIRITDTPVKGIAAKRMLSRHLSVVGCPAAVVIFGTLLVVRLCRHAPSEGIAVVAYLVEDVLQLIFMVSAAREEGKVEHGAHPGVVVILVINRVAEIVAPVVGHIIHSKQVVEHPVVCTPFVAVVHGRQQAERMSVKIPAVTQVGRQFQVGQRRALLHHPVVVEAVALQVDAIACDGGQGRMNTTVDTTFAVVKSQEIGSRPLGIEKVAPLRAVVVVATHRNVECIFCRNLLGIDDDEAT